MISTKHSLFPYLAAALVGVAACTGSETGTTSSSSSGTGGTTTSSPTGGTSTGGVGGGGAQCTKPADCPAPPNDCVLAKCNAGVCDTELVPTNVPVGAQTAGDCRWSGCDGAGNPQEFPDDTDLPDDKNDCTTDTCDDDTPMFTPVAVGTDCGNGMICDDAGHCVGCVAPGDCGDDTECLTYTCDANVCGTVFTTQGTLAGTQTPGDCHESQCDGNGDVEIVVDDTDVPDDDEECTTDACDNGAPSNASVAAGTACTQDNGVMCDGDGACVQCILPAECGADTPCQTRTCVAGLCGVANVAAGTVVANPTVGDCRSNRCDGNGNIVTGAADNTDLPVDDKQCTSDVCTAGTPSNPPLAQGTACTQNGTKCNAVGVCVECLQPSDCGASTACKTYTCTAGACGVVNTAAGTTVSNTTPGDCRSDKCDGNGNLTTSAVDDTDLPVDSKQCTSDVCAAGAPSNPALPVGTACNQSGGAKCDSAGNCVACLQASDCGITTACKTFTCSAAGACSSANTAAGTVVSNTTVGDCHSDQCDGNGNLVPNAVDNNDEPADEGNQCTLETCTTGTPGHPAAPQGTTCNQNGGSTCNGSGQCVTCLLDSECPTGNACQVPRCNAGVCGFDASPAGDLAAALQTAGDCQKKRCDGAGSIVSVADNTDVPADDGEQCTSDTCNNGAPVHPPVALGTACNQDGGAKCDATGSCVECNTPADCPAGANECQTAACDAGACGMTFAAAGTATVLQTNGDCQKTQCDDDGDIESIPDDADVPADDGNECTGETCTAGAPQHPPIAQGTACTQDGGEQCDGAGACVGLPPPTVASTTPSDGASALASTTIAVGFSAAMNPATLTAQTAMGACTGSLQVSVNDFASCVGFTAAAPTLSPDNSVATLTPQPGLLVNRTYKIRVTTAAASATGKNMAASFTTTTGFATTDPRAVVFAQVYGGGGANSGTPTFKYDYVVLHNRSGATVNLTGWSLQYTSATGTAAWNVASLATTAVPNPTIAPGGYLFVQLGSPAGTAGADFPVPPDLTPSPTLNLSATGGKVALVRSTTALNGGGSACPPGATIADMLGYGTANCFEGTKLGALTNASGAVRAVNGCLDTDTNSMDFSIVPNPVPIDSTATPVLCAPTQNETGNPLEADWCDTQHPLTLSVAPGASTGDIYGRIYETGVTEAAGANPSVLAQLGYGPATANPQYEAGWTWLATTFNVQNNNDDEYQASFTAPAAGDYRYTYRFSLDNGVTYTYCDNAQSDGGAGSNANLAFDLENLAVLSVK